MDETERYVAAARIAASDTGVPLSWILGVIGKESSFQAVPAPVYEPNSSRQEYAWGPMQILGSTARDRQLQGPLEQLLVPEVGILYGAKHLAWLRDRYGGNFADVISAYNWGHPEPVRGAGYVRIVEEWISSMRDYAAEAVDENAVGGLALIGFGLGLMWFAAKQPRNGRK